jgi:TonB family protein
METIEPPGSAFRDTEHEPNFLLVRDTSGDWPRWKRAAIGTAIIHLIVITLLFSITSGPTETAPPEREYTEHVTKLYVPKELTQKAPNKGPVATMMMSKPAAPSPKLSTPAPQQTKAASPAPPAPVPVPVAPPPPPPPVVPPAPAPGETARNQPPAPTPPPVTVPKPEPPKMIVEDSMQANPQAPKPGGKLLVPTDPIAEAMRNRGTGSSSTRIGDSAEMSVGAGLHLPAAAARLSNFELKSDPMGVDFWPYLQRVLAAVKLNWSAVYPQAARLGLRGQVTLEFSVRKDGLIDHIVWDERSGSNALDNAAVAAISASEHLPPLPTEYKGDKIVLKMSFMYNMPR